VLLEINKVPLEGDADINYDYTDVRYGLTKVELRDRTFQYVTPYNTQYTGSQNLYYASPSQDDILWIDGEKKVLKSFTYNVRAEAVATPKEEQLNEILSLVLTDISLTQNKDGAYEAVLGPNDLNKAELHYSISGEAGADMPNKYSYSYQYRLSKRQPLSVSYIKVTLLP